ncbi:hypothetical protein D3C81_1677130 [compost metagenome]
MPGFLAILVGHAGPEVEHGFPADLHAEGGAALLWVIEEFGESLLRRLEAQVEIALDLHRRTPVEK